jgi:uncharacterized membrane protein
VCAATGFYFLTNVPDSGDVWVGWRAGHLLLIAFAVLSAAAASAAWQRRSRRALLVIVGTALVLPALPTVAIDVFNAQDITNREQGPEFPWTLVITPGEREALDWVRTETPPTAVVQVEPNVRGAKHWSYIGAFAERRAVAGLPGSMIPMKPYRMAADDLYRGVFRGRNASDSHRMARFLGVDYLFVGLPERRAYPDVIHHIANTPELFSIVFKNDAVTIFRVLPVGPGPLPPQVRAPVRR